MKHDERLICLLKIRKLYFSIGRFPETLWRVSNEYQNMSIRFFVGFYIYGLAWMKEKRKKALYTIAAEGVISRMRWNISLHHLREKITYVYKIGLYQMDSTRFEMSLLIQFWVWNRFNDFFIRLLMLNLKYYFQ